MSGSSTAPFEVKSFRRGALVGSTSIESMHPTVDVVQVSAGTLTSSWRVLGTVPSPDELYTTFAQYVTEADIKSPAGIVIRYTADTDWLVQKSTPLGMPDDTFPPTQLFHATSNDWGPDCAISVHGSLPSTKVLNRTIRIQGSLPFVTVVNLGPPTEPQSAIEGILSSTGTGLGIRRFVESKLTEAVDLARNEWFEDGTESHFFRTLSALLFAYGDASVATLETFLSSPSSNIEVAVEAAQWLGETDHLSSRHYRRTLLEKLLRSTPSTRLRHGAAAGLAFMDDPSSLPALREALEREGNRRLQRYLALVVEQLERTRACRSS